MAGTFTGKVMGEGQLPNTKGTLYTVPASTVAFVKRITLFNTNAAQQTINVYLNPGGTSRQWRKYVLEQYESAEVLEAGDAVILEAGDLIEADTTTAAAVDYVISGVEET